MPTAPKPTTTTYLVFAMKDDPSADLSSMEAEDMPKGVWVSMLTCIVEADTEEEAVAKVDPIVPLASNFAIVAANKITSGVQR